MTVTEAILTELKPSRQLFVKKLYTEFYEYPQKFAL
jgi:hypothetical protein